MKPPKILPRPEWSVAEPENRHLQLILADDDPEPGTRFPVPLIQYLGLLVCSRPVPLPLLELPSRGAAPPSRTTSCVLDCLRYKTSHSNYPPAVTPFAR